jgi:hypothetical protein
MGSRHREVRSKAIAFLGQQGDLEAVGVLTKVGALDLEAELPIRQQAIETLEGLARNNPQAREIMTRLVETVGDQDMRHLLTDILGLPLEFLEEGAEEDTAADTKPQD